MVSLADIKHPEHPARRVWRFIWEEESIWSWIANVALAFVLIKFIAYPFLGFLLSTSHPVVAVISNSMEHDGSFAAWWKEHGAWYENTGIAQEEFSRYSFRNGFNRGDIMVLRGVQPELVQRGMVVVFPSSIRADPIIHRVIAVTEEDGAFLVRTKGDHNRDSYSFETDIPADRIIGRAIVRVPLLGYIKIWFVEGLHFLLGR